MASRCGCRRPSWPASTSSPWHRPWPAAATSSRASLRRWTTAYAGPEGPFLRASARAFAALAVRDLSEACATLDEGMTPLVRHRSAAPLHQFGLWALLRTVVDDRGAEARQTLRGLPAAARLANRAALDYADAVAAGRAGQAETAAALVAAAEDALTPLPWLRRTLRLVALESAVTDGWGDPVPLLRAGLAEHEAHGEETAARTARDLLRRAGAPTRRGRGASAVPPRLAALGVTRRELEVLASWPRPRPTPRSPSGSSSPSAPWRPTSPTCSSRPAPPAGTSSRGSRSSPSSAALTPYAARIRCRPPAPRLVGMTTHTESTSYDVVVVGAGPSGLATAVAASRAGARVLVVERHESTSTFPKATGVRPRTMEILRSWGLEEQVLTAAPTSGWPPRCPRRSPTGSSRTSPWASRSRRRWPR